MPSLDSSQLRAVHPECGDCYDLAIGGFCSLQNGSISKSNYVGYGESPPEWCPRLSRNVLSKEEAMHIAMRVEAGAFVSRRELVQLAVFVRTLP